MAPQQHWALVTGGAQVPRRLKGGVHPLTALSQARAPRAPAPRPAPGGGGALTLTASPAP
jgi:hypothetical protein